MQSKIMKNIDSDVEEDIVMVIQMLYIFQLEQM